MSNFHKEFETKFSIQEGREEFIKGCLPPFYCRSVLTLGVGVSRTAQEEMAATEGAQGNGLLIKLPTATTSQHQVVMQAHPALEVEEVTILSCSAHCGVHQAEKPSST